jgi:hypothetical protein
MAFELQRVIFGILNILDRIKGTVLCIVVCSIAALAFIQELDTNHFHQLWQTQNVSRHFQMSSEDKIIPDWEPLGFNKFIFKKNIFA